MSVNINFRPTSNATRWASIKDGDFVILEGNQEHPVPAGLYRIFVMPPDPTSETASRPQYVLLPMFDGPFNPGLFPYVLSEGTLPEIKHLIHKVHIEVEVHQ